MSFLSPLVASMIPNKKTKEGEQMPGFSNLAYKSILILHPTHAHLTLPLQTFIAEKPIQHSVK